MGAKGGELVSGVGGVKGVVEVRALPSSFNSRGSGEQQAERLAALPCSKSLEIYLREIYKSKKESKESLFPRVSRESFLRGRDFFSGKFFGTMVFFFLK